MAASSVKVEWLPKGFEQLFKYDEGISQVLMEQGEKCAAKNNRRARELAHSELSDDPYSPEIRRLRHTQVCTVHSNNAIAAAIGRAHGLPKK